MTIYFLRQTDSELVKIGHSIDVAKRIANLSVAVPHGLVLLATCMGGLEVEQYLHEALESHRCAREWYYPHEDVMRFVEEAKRHGRLALPIASDISEGRVEAPASLSPMAAIAELQRKHGYPEAVACAVHCLNELTIREFRGRFDTISAARDRVCDRIGVRRTFGKRIWQRAATMRDVPADPVFRLVRALTRSLAADGATDAATSIIGIIGAASLERA